MSASKARGLGTGRLLRQLRKGLAGCVLLLFVVLLRGQVFPGPEVYGQETVPGLTRLFLTRHDLHENLGQRKLFHIPTRDLYLPAFFSLVDPESANNLRITEGADRSTNCTLTKTNPTFHICVYPQQFDIFISAALTSQGVWEPQITKLYQLALRKFPQSMVIDVGANIGYYSLLAAAMGHQVIAVEPSPANVRKLTQGVQLNGVSDKVYVLQNALARSHRNVSLSVNSNNQGGIKVLEEDREGDGGDPHTVRTVVMDDLLHLVRSTTTTATATVIIKIDIEGYECRGMAASAKLFHTVHVPYILMEWQQMYKYRHQMTAACPVDIMRQMTDYFIRLGYHAHEVRTGLALNPQRSTTGWHVGDVYWRHDSQPPLIPPL